MGFAEILIKFVGGVVTRFAIAAAGILASFVFLAFAAPVRLAAAVDCESWNTEAFFETATPAKARECL